MADGLIAEPRAARAVPVVRTRDRRHTATAVQWLRAAGLRIFEITMTVPDATALIRDLASDPALLVGAGTVPDRSVAEACLDEKRNAAGDRAAIEATARQVLGCV
jgi:2-dehydro-3-deoxyphosphogluconate aldolase/(4S)-4-hydroxy-2-oxoglutarate aldolase